MKKSIALLISLFYLLFCFASLRAEAPLPENKESQENVFSVKQLEESSANHFAETPLIKHSFNRITDKTRSSQVPIQSVSFSSPVPLFLKNCNFRR